MAEPASLRVQWPTLAAAVTVRLDWDRAPQTCARIAAILPFASVQEHGVITGAMLYASTPISTTLRENVLTFLEMKLGACFFAAASQNVGMIYGEVNEPQGQSIWGAVVPDDLETLLGVGRAVWANTVTPMGHGGGNPHTRQIIPVTFG